jgi:FeS assembly SUF system regulator
MLRISKLTDYAILIMVEATRAGGEVLSAQTLAERARVELPTASKVLKLLSRAGLVGSQRGAGGGYQAITEARNISVASVISAIEGPIAMTECSIEAGLCSQETHCDLRSNWRRISVAVAEALENVTLAEMAGPVMDPNPNHDLMITTMNA